MQNRRDRYRRLDGRTQTVPALRCYLFNMASRSLTSFSSSSCCRAMRPDVRSSSCAPEDAAVCSINCRILSRSTAMRSLSSGNESELSLLMFVPLGSSRRSEADARSCHPSSGSDQGHHRRSPRANLGSAKHRYVGPPKSTTPPKPSMIARRRWLSYLGPLKSPRSQIVALNLLSARTRKPAFNLSRFF
jgi:hypothetical protein